MAIPVAFQATIAATGTAQELPSNALQFGSGTLLAKSGNTAVIAIGNSSAVTSSNGALLPAGSQIPVVGLLNTNALWINGTSGDVISFIGA